MAHNAEMHLLYRVGNAPIYDYPYPHIYVREVFPPKFYHDLRRHLPPKEALSTLKALQRVTDDYPDGRFVLPLAAEHIEDLPEPYRMFWSETAEWLLEGQFASLVLGKFQRHLDKRFGNAKEKEYEHEALLVQDYTTYRLAPHTDSPSKVLSFLFYLPETAALSELGTSIYVPKRKDLVSDGTMHHSPELFDRLYTVPYEPNTLFAFLKTPNAFHGVEPITQPDVRRDLLLYDIKVKSPDTHSPGSNATTPSHASP